MEVEVEVEVEVEEVNRSRERIPECSSLGEEFDPVAEKVPEEVEVDFDGRIEESGGMWGGGMIQSRYRLHKYLGWCMDTVPVPTRYFYLMSPSPVSSLQSVPRSP